MWYGCGNTALPNPSTMRITLGRDGALTFFNGAVDIGQGSSTVLLQIAADALGLPPQRLPHGGRRHRPDGRRRQDLRLAADLRLRQRRAPRRRGPAPARSWRSPTPARTRSSRSTARASPIADGEASREIDLDAVIPEFRASENPDPGASTALGRLARCALGGMTDASSSKARHWDPPTTRSMPTARASPTPPTASPRRWPRWRWTPCSAPSRCIEIVAAHDVGRAINPTLVEGQIHGGIAQGLGMALMEEFIPGRTENLHDYLIPTAGDMPPVKTYLIEDAEPNGPFGAKGVGEPALIATAPAILSAIRHATGVRLTRVPVLPHRLWEAIAM